MSEKWTKEKLARKVDWEGGVSDAITGYGLGQEILPEDTPEEVFYAWGRIQASAMDIKIVNDWLEPED